MQRYFFDTRDGGNVIIDDIGTCVAGPLEAKEVAATALAEWAQDVLPGSFRRCLAVDVRDADSNAVLTAEMTFEAQILV